MQARFSQHWDTLGWCLNSVRLIFSADAARSYQLNPWIYGEPVRRPCWRFTWFVDVAADDIPVDREGSSILICLFQPVYGSPREHETPYSYTEPNPFEPIA